MLVNEDDLLLGGAVIVIAIIVYYLTNYLKQNTAVVGAVQSAPIHKECGDQ